MERTSSPGIADSAMARCRLAIAVFTALVAWPSFAAEPSPMDALRGVFPQGTFEATAGVMMCDLLRTVGGRTW